MSLNKSSLFFHVSVDSVVVFGGLHDLGITATSWKSPHKQGGQLLKATSWNSLKEANQITIYFSQETVVSYAALGVEL